MEGLRGKYAGRDVEFIVAYVKEAHPGEPAYRDVKQPATLDERLQNARRLVDEKHMEVTVGVDNMDDSTAREFGLLPNMIYVIDKSGTIVFKSTWTRSERIDEVLSELTAAEAESARPMESAAG